jgi:hypothetical protein
VGGLGLRQAASGLPVLGRRSTIPEDSLSLDELLFIQPRPARLDLWGRITEYGTPVRETPGLGTLVARFLERNVVLPLLEEVHSPGGNPNNDLWYRIGDGYVYTTTVQRIKPYHTPQEIDAMPSDFGFWAEVVVPYTFARSQPSGHVAEDDNSTPMVLYYGSVYRVIGIEADAAGFPWYKLQDDKPKALPIYGLARHLRRIVDGDLTPLSPGKDKRIVVNLDKQQINCYEDNQIVFSTLTSSGGEGFETPRGEWWVVLKQPSRHMYSDPNQEAFSDPNYFDLPGVPFTTFFTTMGHAIHGTYWHGDFGRPRSHGCLNVTPEDARWIFRWSEPAAPYESDFVPGNRQTGTPVIVT